MPMFPQGPKRGPQWSKPHPGRQDASVPIPIPIVPIRQTFADGNFNVAALGLVLGAAAIFHQQPQAAQPTPVPAEYAYNQRALDQPAALVFHQPPPTFVAPQTPAIHTLLASPQADPTQIAAVWLAQQPPTALPPRNYQTLFGAPQQDPTQLAAITLKQAPQGAQPGPLAQWVQPPQTDPSMPRSTVFGAYPWQAVPLAPVRVGQPQADPTQPPALFFKYPPPTQVVLTPPVFAGVRFAQGQDPTQYQGAIYAQPWLWSPAQPQPQTPGYSVSRDERLWIGYGALFGQTIIPSAILPESSYAPQNQYGPEFQQIGSTLFGAYIYPSAAPQPKLVQFLVPQPQPQPEQPTAFVVGQKPFSPVPLGPVLSVPPQADPTQVPASVFGPVALPRPPQKFVTQGQPQADPTQPAASVFGTLPFAPTPLHAIVQSAPQPELNQPGALFFRFPPPSVTPSSQPQFGLVTFAYPVDITQIQGFNAASPWIWSPVQPKLVKSVFGSPQADPTQVPAQVFAQQPQGTQPYPVSQILAMAGQDQTQPPARVFIQPPLTDTPYSRTTFASPQFDPTFLAPAVFSQQPAPYVPPTPPPNKFIMFGMQQADPSQYVQQAQFYHFPPPTFVPAVSTRGNTVKGGIWN